MPTKEEVIRAALRAWPGGDLIPVDMENMSPQELLEAAKKREFGDTLLSFIVIELFEGLDVSEDGQVDLDRGVKLINRAIRDLQAVSRALFRLSMQEKPKAAQELLSRIFDILYLDTGPEGDFYNRDKSWSPDTLDQIATVVRPVCRGCDGGGTLSNGQTCDECEGSGLAPEDWAEGEDYT